MENFLRVRVDIGDQLRRKQKKEFNKICMGMENDHLLEILKFKFRI